MVTSCNLIVRREYFLAFRFETIVDILMNSCFHRFLAPLSMTRGLQNVEAAEGDEVLFEVQLSKPDPRVQWFKDGKPLSANKMYGDILLNIA